MALDTHPNVSTWRDHPRFEWYQGQEAGLAFEYGCPTVTEMRTACAFVRMSVVD